jgi:hypothetical protein
MSAAKHVLHFRRLIMQRNPPVAGAARQQHQANRAGIAFETAAELLGDCSDLAVAALGIVHHDEQTLVVAVGDQLSVLGPLPECLRRGAP